MKKLLPLLLLLLTACDADFGRREESADLKERAVVEDVIFAPSQHGSASGVGMSMSGNMVVTSGSVSIPEKYAIVFRCEHGKFIIQGEGSRYKDLWHRMVKGREVTVTFREVHRVYKDGRREFVKYDFIGAS